MGSTCPQCAAPREDLDAPCPVCGRAKETAPSRIDRYDVLRPLGRGGMGRVYLARDERLERDVAVKVLAEAFADDTMGLERFRREARLASALNHPHICTIHDFGEEAGHPFIVMEHVEGTALSELPRDGLSMEQILRAGAQVARALAAAHAAGIVHRDIKPGNVMLRADGYVKVVDFGLARPARADPSAPAGAPLTATGTVVGTVRYMSPEQVRSEEVGPPSDVFSLGVVLYELATGRHPFRAASEGEVIQAILSHSPPTADRLEPTVPADVGRLVERMLARDPSLRPRAADVADVLERVVGVDGAAPRSVTRRKGARRPIVGRRREREQCLAAFDEVAGGRGLFVCVTGEPGIGKTTLMEDVLQELEAGGRACAVARGRCSERLAGTEAYLPVLEALEGLLQSDGGDDAARTMKAIAPSWYAQVAPLAGEDSSLARTLQEGGGVTQERLKRELVALVTELSRQRPLVLLLDDVHWADASTVDVLAYLGARCQDQRLLLIASYRPTDLALAEHPFADVKLDLQARGRCREVPLGFLSREDVEEYMALTFPGHDFPAELGDLIHDRTEGSPLFMVDLLGYLKERDVLVEADGRWTLGRSLPDLVDQLPESVRGMVQRKIEQIGEDDRRLLVAASVQGYEFDAIVVSEALGRDAAEVEERLDAIERIHSVVQEVDERELPDRTLTLRYRFIHVLYQNALFATLRPTRRAGLCKSVAESLLRHHGEDGAHIEAELALLFEGARDFERATAWFLEAARHAVRLFANHEAVTLAQRGLDLLKSLPASEDRDRRELALLVTLGPPLKDTRGWGAPEVGQVYARANELCEHIGGTKDLFPALWGMWLTYSSSADMDTLKAMGRRLLSVAEESGDRGNLLQAHHALTTSHFVAGDFRLALHHGREAGALYDPKAHADHAFVYAGHDPGSCCSGFAAQCLWMLGYPDQSLERGRATVEMAEQRGHPVSLALAYYTFGVLHQLRRDVEETRRFAEACQELAVGQGAPIFPESLLAWAAAHDGRLEDSLAALDAALAHPEKIPLWWQSYFLGLKAEALGMAGRHQEALESTERAFSLIGNREIGNSMIELHRLQGVFLRALSRPADAEEAFQKGLERARRHEARMLELRTWVSLGELLRDLGRGAEIREPLTQVLTWFTEGFESRDVQDAQAMLEAIEA